MKFLAILIPTFSLILKVSVKDFKPAFGNWKGTLTYLDYSSGKPYSMPCNMILNPDKANPQQIVIAFEYPNEPKANGNDTLVISNDGKMIDKGVVVTKKKKGGMLLVITEENGVDGNDSRKAVIRHIYEAGKKSFSIRKEVKFEGEEKWILRNEYKMAR